MEPNRIEIYHPKYNLECRNNLTAIPTHCAVYGLFAIIDDQPVHCRFVGATDNLQAAITRHFEMEPEPGIHRFMQGPWIKLLVFEPVTSAADSPQTAALVDEWVRRYSPSCDGEGDYAGVATAAVS